LQVKFSPMLSLGLRHKMSVKQGVKYASANLFCCVICYVLPIIGVVRSSASGATHKAGVWLGVLGVGGIIYIVFCYILAHEVIEEYNS
ncbi:MAG: hypothetical protein KAJ39_10155, partial [Gammaproteobacteria bacterium]|nr:hypothetical protein [Gammaproteobacteria bacterium]